MSEFAEYLPRPDSVTSPQKKPDLVIRCASEGDIDAIAAICAAREGERVDRWRTVFTRECAESSSGRVVLLVAELDGVLSGFGKAAYFTPPKDAPAHSAPAGWYLGGVVVKPSDRRRGVGAALTGERMAWIARRAGNVSYLASAQNRATIDLHRQFGFDEVTRDFWFPKVDFTGGVGILFSARLAGTVCVR